MARAFISSSRLRIASLMNSGRGSNPTRRTFRRTPDISSGFEAATLSQVQSSMSPLKPHHLADWKKTCRDITSLHPVPSKFRILLPWRESTHKVSLTVQTQSPALGVRGYHTRGSSWRLSRVGFLRQGSPSASPLQRRNCCPNGRIRVVLSVCVGAARMV